MLRLSSPSVKHATSGKLITLANSDMTMIEQSSISLFFIVQSPISIVLSIYLLFLLLGPTAAYCLGIGVALILINIPISAFLLASRLSISKWTDSRLGMISKLVLGIQTVKSYVW